MQNALNRLREMWQNTSRANQTMLVAIVGIAALVGIGFVYWASTPDYTSLVTNARPDNAGKITAMLDQRKVNYRILNEGTIQVPAAEAPKLRMALASEGLLESGSLGYELLDKQSFTMTASVEKENIKRAQEGEMEKSIQSLEPVRSARVHLAQGSDEPFVDPDKKEASASIIVHLKPGHELTKDNVSAIVSLVQAGYTNLTRKNINLVDGEGHLLFNGAEMESGIAGPDDRQALERRTAVEITQQIRQQLLPLGKDRFQVAVRVKLNLDRRREQTRESTKGAQVSSTSQEETMQGNQVNVSRQGAGASGNLQGPGAPRPGVPPDIARGSGDQPGKYVSKSDQTTFAPGERVTETIRSPGETKLVNVSVLLDSDKITKEQADTVKQQVENLLGGADPATGTLAPMVQVDRFKFDNTATVKEKQEQIAAASAERTNRLLGYAVPFGLMLLMLIILAKSLRRSAPKVTQIAGQIALAGGNGLQPALAGAGYGGGGLNMLVGDNQLSGINYDEAAINYDDEGKIIPIRQGEQIHTYEVISEQFDSNLESILHLARSKPDMVARLIKSWIIEEPMRK